MTITDIKYPNGCMPMSGPSSQISEKLLIDIIEDNEGFTPIELCSITKALVAHLKKLQDDQIVHADIKLEKIILSKSIIERHYTFFGIEKSSYSRLFTEEYPVSGTGCYKPPEFHNLQDLSQYRDRSGYKEKCDPWALGLVLYLMYVSSEERDKIGEIFTRFDEITSTSDDKSEAMHDLYVHIEDVRCHRFSKDLWLHKLLQGLLHPDPNERFSANQAFEVSKQLTIEDFREFFQ